MGGSQPEVTLYFDASVSIGDETAGVGYVVVTPQGRVIHKHGQPTPYTESVAVAEFRAMELGLNWVVDEGFNTCTVVGDSRSVIQIMDPNHRASPRCTSMKAMFDAVSQILVPSFEVSFLYVGRKWNWLADEMATKGREKAGDDGILLCSQ